MADTYEFAQSEKSWSVTLKNENGDFLWAESFPKGSKIVEIRENTTTVHIDSVSRLDIPNEMISEPTFTDFQDLFNKISSIVN